MLKKRLHSYLDLKHVFGTSILENATVAENSTVRVGSTHIIMSAHNGSVYIIQCE